MKKVIVLVLVFALVFPVLGFAKNVGHAKGPARAGNFHGGFYKGGNSWL